MIIIKKFITECLCFLQSAASQTESQHWNILCGNCVGNEVNNGYIVTTMEREFDLKKATQDYIALNGCLLKK